MLILMPLFSAFIAASVSDNIPFQLWAVDPMVKVFQDTKPAENFSVEINCARNEYQSGQFSITALEDLENVTVELSDLIHESGYKIPENRVSWNFVGYVSVIKNTYNTPDSVLLRKAPADFPDTLIEEQSIGIKAGETRPVWLTLFTPEDAPAGKYLGKVTVKTPSGEKMLNISLNVYPFALPDKQHLYVTLWFNPGAIAKFHNVEMWSEDYWQVLKGYAKNMAEHGQNVVETKFPFPLGQEKDGSLTIDYARMDRWIEFFEQNGSCERIEFPSVAHAVIEEGRSHWDSRELTLNKISIKDAETGESVDIAPQEAWALFLADLNRHLRERGWHEKAMIHISDEPTIYKVESYCKIADFIHKYAPDLKIIEAIETTGFGKCLDVWVPKLSHYMNWYDEYEAQRKAGTEMWFYTCCHPYGVFPNRFLDFALIKTRLLFWLNWKYRFDGYLHWGLNHWIDDPFKGIGEGLPPGDRYIIYPGKDGPMNSIRWEASREGLQDYELFRLLAQKVKKVKDELGSGADFIDENQRSDEICQSVVRSFTDYESDPPKLREARELLAQEIIEMDKHPLILVQTSPRAETEVVPGPILVLIRGVAEKGTKIRIGKENAVLKDNGSFAGHAFVSPGETEIIIEAEIDGKKKMLHRNFAVK